MVAAGIVAAMHEMVDNVYRHSGQWKSGIVGYRWSKGEVEYVVADSGIGILASLRQHPNYVNISDHAAALQTALSDSESRFGRASGHGNGFRTVFLSLATLNGSLRFRSGDHSLEVNGVTPSLAKASIFQRLPLAGFVVTVTCRT